MPTSSQALILLSVDGQLPIQDTEQKQSLTSVPYPVRFYDINDSCIEPPAKNAFGRRGTRIDFHSLIETLPDILSIKGYSGALSFDPGTKQLHWKVDVDSPPRRKQSLVTRKAGLDYYQDGDNQGRQFRLPSLYEDERESVSTGLISERDLFYADSLYHADHGQPLPDLSQTEAETQSVDQKQKKRLSLPVFLKSTENENLQTRLYSLGFRRPSYPSPRSGQNQQTGKRVQNTDHKNVLNQDHKKDSNNQNVPQAWEAEFDEKFKGDNLTLQDLQNYKNDFKKIHDSQQNLTEYNLNEYMEDRNKFFAKFGFYLHEDFEHVKESLKEARAVQNRIKIPGTTNTDLQTTLAEIGVLNSRKAPQQENPPQQEDIVDRKQPEKVSLIEDVSHRLDYNKWKKQKLTTVRLRKEPPPSQPLAVCFSLHDNVKSHGEIKTLIEEQLGCQIVSIQFDPTSVHALAVDAKSRWVVTLRKKEHVDILKLNGLHVDGETITVRSLDDAVKDEVEAYRLFQMVKNGQIRLSGYGDAKNKTKKSRNAQNMSQNKTLLQYASKEEVPV